MATIAGAALGLAVIAGCASRGGGGSGLAGRSDTSPGGAIQFAAAQVEAAKTVHVHAALSGDVTGSIDGAVVLAPTLEGDLAIKLDKNTEMVPNHVIYDGKTVYAALPQGLHATSKAKPKAAWLAVDTTGSGNGAASGGEAAIFAMLRQDPATLVKAALAKGKFAQAGSETVDGVAATRFTGDVAGGAPGHVDVWLDKAGLPVKLLFQSTDPTAKGRTEVRFSDWGKAVTVTAPPDDEVITATDEASFAISGQEFKVSGDRLSGGGLGPNGLPGLVVTTIGGSAGSGQSLCVPVPDLPQASPGSCVTISFSAPSLAPPSSAPTATASPKPSHR